ncbi:MAG: hypothetical protein L3J31_00415 [Bacteroidales bacterium]|nr:hypothetical protein [Bacteroidales bacterium]MCF6341253.1 hypothetical protein [Bacteroidales bacterium]
MNEITSINKFYPGHSLSLSEIKNILFELTSLNGIASLNVEENSVKIEYYQQLLSPDIVKDALVRAGFPFEHDVKVHGLLKKLILKLGEENNKEFGGKAPKCCG